MTTNSQNAAEMAAAAQSDLLQALDRRGELTVVEAALCCVAHELAAQRASRDGFPDSLGRMSIEAHQRSQWEDQVAALTARVAALEEAGDHLASHVSCIGGCDTTHHDWCPCQTVARWREVRGG